MFKSVDIARLVWKDAQVAHLRMPPSSPDEATPPVALPGAIAVGYNGQKDAVVMLASGRTVSRDVPPGTIGMTGGEPVRWLRTTRPAEVVELATSPSLRKGIAAELRADRHSDLADLHGWESLGAWAILDRFRAAVRGRHPLSDVERDTLVRRLYALVLCDRFGGRLAETSRKALDKRRLTRVIDFVEAHLGSELTLDRLASVAGYSPFHFSRAFKAAIGWAPHQFVSIRRLAHARQRIVHTSESVEAIAHHLGYSNISHFRRQFRAYAGLLPSELRGG
jgi:AraC family transcriptional regulator